jgi:hypothetical protein
MIAPIIGAITKVIGVIMNSNRCNQKFKIGGIKKNK